MKNLYIDIKQSAGGGTVISDEWVRPDDWLALPVLAEGDQKFVGLHAVYGDSDFVSVLCAGAYTVDWGDGTVEDVAANTKKDHLFSYAALAGTESSRGYRQAIVTITPQAGQLLTKIDLQQKHSQAGLSSYASGWLDINIVSPNVNTLLIGGSILVTGLLEQFNYIGINNITSVYNVFLNCYVLQSIQLYTSNCINFNNMFYGCSNLRTSPVLDTKNGNSFNGMFAFCYSLHYVYNYNTSKGATFSAMFQSCYSITDAPFLDLSSATTTYMMFSDCISLINVPNYDLSKLKDSSRMYFNCRLINTLPLFDFSLVSNATLMLYGCYSLQKVIISNIGISFSISNCKFSAAEIVELFNELSIVSSATITITGNWGAAYLTDTQKAIATNKGWTLVL